MSADTSRLDSFTDAAFAFAVTLLVIGGGAMPDSYDGLRDAFNRVPTFAMGFALIAMFWHAHVRWRRICGGTDLLSVTLTMLLVFLVLVYVYPLRLIASATISWMVGNEARMAEIAGGGRLADLFTLYGLGFMAMAGTVAALFALGRKRCATDSDRLAARVELGTWLILIAFGGLSVAMAQFEPTVKLAGFAYSLLPIAIPLWVRHATRAPALKADASDAT